MEISILVWRSVILDLLCHGVNVSCKEYDFITDLVVLVMSDVDISLGMDLMMTYKV